MDLDGILDPSSLVAMAEDALDRSLDALALAMAARDAAAGSATGAAVTLARMQALAAGLGVTTQWVGAGRRQLQIMGPDGTFGPASGDLGGQKGDTGASPVLRAGSKAVGPLAFAIDNTDPLHPLVNVTIPSGNDGWSPVAANVVVGAAVVQRVVDWTGGSGAKPAVGLYLAPGGLVADPAQATNVRGAVGPTGANFIGLSTTPRPIALGPVTVTLTPATAATFAPCATLALISQSDARNAMAGLLQGYDPQTGTLSINVLTAAGSGSHADWLVAPSMVLTIPPVIDDGLYDAPQPASAVSITYAAGGAAATTDDGTY